MLSPELRQKVWEFATSRLSVRQFEDWLLPRLASYVADVDSDDADMIAAVTLAFAELRDGLQTVDECRDYLVAELRARPLPIMEPIAGGVETSSATTIAASSLLMQPAATFVTATAM